MSNVYKVTVYESITSDGVFGYLAHGTAVEVDGTRYAKRPGGALMPAGDDWADTAEEAWRAAAPRLIEIANKIHAQAQRWQEGRA
jgi:hypothetical protein